MTTAMAARTRGAISAYPSGMFTKGSMNDARRAIAVPSSGRYVRIAPKGIPSLAARGSARGVHEVAETSEALSAGQSSVATAATMDASFHHVHAPMASVSLVGFNPLPLITRVVVPVVAKINGPMAVLLTLFSAVMALWAFIMARFRNQTANCTTCKAYGLKRCTLCKGAGTITWEGKFAHNMACPVCLGRRFERCQDCGGRTPRALFQHQRPAPLEAVFNAMDMEEEQEKALTRQGRRKVAKTVATREYFD